MSLSARIELSPSRRVAQAEIVFPLLGLLIAATTIATRWPIHRASLLAAAAVVFVLVVVVARRRLSSNRLRYQLTLSDHAEIDLWPPTPPAIDGSARLVESTVVWPGFWMLALRSAHGARIVRLPVLPSGLRVETRWALGRFLVWAIRARDDRLDDREKAVN